MRFIDQETLFDKTYLFKGLWPIRQLVKHQDGAYLLNPVICCKSYQHKM